MSEVWMDALQVIRTLNEGGHKAYIVGGAVRDWLLKRQIADVDIVTTATPDEVHSLFSKTFQMNNQHQTVIVRVNHEHYEVTTIRGGTLEDDLHLRDLTINSIALDEQNQLLDPTGGEVDLREGRLRSYHPDERMSEDPLRMLRVYRFVSELGFTIDSALKASISAKRKAIQGVAMERIVKEWVKLLKGKQRNRALNEMVETRIYESIPGLALTESLLKELSQLPSLQAESEVVCWTAFCLCSNDTGEPPLKQLALSNELLRGIRDRLRFFQRRERETWSPFRLYEATLEVALDVEKLRSFLGLVAQPARELTKLWNELPLHEKADLAISGRDLLQSVKQPGPWVKEELMWAEAAVVTGEIENDKELLLKALERRREER